MKRTILFVMSVLLIPSVGYAEEEIAIAEEEIFLDIEALESAEKEPSRCDFFAAIDEAKKLIADVPAPHGDKTALFYRTFTDGENGPYAKPGKRVRDYVTREIPLALLNVNTCDLEMTVITRRIEKSRGILKTAPDSKFAFDIEERVYGKLWNEWNTPYLVTPSEWVVILNKWKRGDETEFLYVPFSNGLLAAFPDIPGAGQSHYDNDIVLALSNLDTNKVFSKVFPEFNATDVIFAAFFDSIQLIPLAEQTDAMEFYAYRIGVIDENPFERVQFTIGANGNSAYQFTQSGAGAKNLMQIWPPTCTSVRDYYPAAQISYDCSGGKLDAHGHIEAIETAVLLYDMNLESLMVFEKSGFLGSFTRAFIRSNFVQEWGYYPSSFTQNLGLGMKHESVRVLQQFLNQNGFPVATVGPGSIGNETDVFGPHTTQALLNFQKSYEGEIFGSPLPKDKELRDELGRMLFAAYNGGVARVIGALKAYGNGWDRIHYASSRKKGARKISSASLRPETISYIDKFDFLKENFEAILYMSRFDP